MSIADAFAGTLPVQTPQPVPNDPQVPKDADANPAGPAFLEGDVDRPAEITGWVASAAATVRADLRGAWLWDTHGPSPRSLWKARIPDLDAVPGGNRALWLAWCVYNHVALLALFPLMFAFWLGEHPARLLYAAPIAAPLTVLWLI